MGESPVLYCAQIIVLGFFLMRTLRLALAQIDTTVGDLEGNTSKIIRMMDLARAQGADVVSFPELAVTGYPPEDLLFKPQFIQDNLKQLRYIASRSRGIVSVVGFVDPCDGGIRNAAAVLCNGKQMGVYHKMYLPNYGVFDEKRYFVAGTLCPIFVIGDVCVGVNICEDVWYPNGPTVLQSQAGADVIININSSPYHVGKRNFREKMVATRALDNALIMSYTNMVGGQDELVFDGGSVVFNQRGELLARAGQFEEELLVVDLDVDTVARDRQQDIWPRGKKTGSPSFLDTSQVMCVSLDHATNPGKSRLERRVVTPLEGPEEVYQALVTGTRDYVKKIGFKGVVVGLSGGIDSSIVATIAADALGSDNVTGVSMPSRYTTEASQSDAGMLAKNLSIRMVTIPIEDPFSCMLATLSGVFVGRTADVTEENLQARIRGNILMALSNKFGWLVLTTGNKSELATGYATLYGDMVGGFAILKDVSKTMVYDLAQFRNSLIENPVIPESVLSKAPSAELRPDQKDEDSLPPYSALDPILKLYVEEDCSFKEIVVLGHDEETVKKVIDMVDRSEYKRRQAPPGVKITPRAFGRDRRLPIVNRYKAY
jgi:NAD+ synthase (glutamine-hydrolysing)